MKIVAKKAFSLLEIMLVIFIIGLIGSVLGYSMKGSLDEGKAFKSEQGSKQLYDIVTLEIAKDPNFKREDLSSKVPQYLQMSGFVKDPAKLIKDGWGKDYELKWDEKSDDLRVVSTEFTRYQRVKKQIAGRKFEERFPWMVEPKGTDHTE